MKRKRQLKKVVPERRYGARRVTISDLRDAVFRIENRLLHEWAYRESLKNELLWMRDTWLRSLRAQFQIGFSDGLYWVEFLGGASRARLRFAKLTTS